MARRFIDPSLAAVAALFIASVGAPAVAADVRHAVGTVSLVVGEANIVSADGAKHSIRRGVSVQPGDRVETALGGHVHIRFIDDALVSVRPSSRLVIEEYQYDPARVAESQVRFRLETGVARAISGAAAEGAKERFRLNTPLVAIGVRGTDFVVNSQSEQTIAHVNQGAIVMAPLGVGCQANALGPCNTHAATLVSAQMGEVLAQYRNGLGQPEIKPQLLASPTYLAAAPVAGSPQSSPASTQPTRLDTATVASKQEDSVIQVSAVIRKDLVSNVVDSRVEPPITPVEPPVTQVPPVPSVPPTTQVPPIPPALAWGHWSKPTDSTDFSAPFRVASIGREVTVGNTHHVLYRSPAAEGGATTIQPSLGEVDFKLQQASAQFRPWGDASQEATAHSGVLSIDFAARKYQTSLQLDHATAGSHALTSSGIVLSDGIFGGASGGQSVIGAATRDGKGAGYFFDKAITSGTFSGITLWGK